MHDCARHFTEAGDTTRALPYLVSAGQSSFGAYSMPEAISYFRQALDALEPTSTDSLAKQAYEGMFGSLAFTNDIEGAVAALEEMLDNALERGAVAMQVSALNKLGFVTALRIGELEKGEAYLARAKQLAEEVDDHTGLAEFHVAYCYVNTTEGRLEKAKEHQLESTRIGVEKESSYDRVFGLAHYADTLLYMGDFDAAEAAIEEARAAAVELGEQQFQGLMIGHTLAYRRALEGRVPEAYALAQEGTEMTAAIGAAVEEATCSWTAGVIAATLGEYEASLDYYDQAIRAAGAAGLPYIVAGSNAAKALIFDTIGQAHRIPELHQIARDTVDAPLGAAMSSPTWADIAMCALEQDELEVAAEATEKGLESVTTLKHLTRPRLLATAALLASREGRSDDAARYIAEADADAKDKQLHVDRPFIDYVYGMVADAAGDATSAIDHLERSVSTAEQMGLRPQELRSRKTLASILNGVDDDAAATQLASARDLVAKMAAGFTDPGLRDSYVGAQEP